MLFNPHRASRAFAILCFGAVFSSAFADTAVSPKDGVKPEQAVDSSATTQSKNDISTFTKVKPSEVPVLPANARSGRVDRNGPVDRSKRGEEIARTALTFRGTPYRFGGSSRSGIDCSGLVRAVCSKWGIYLPRAARQQFSTSVGKRVSPRELQPGDLVFFAGTYKRGTSHVGIYVADGKYIHAATPALGVIVSELSDAYSKKHFCGAIRLDLNKLPTVKLDSNKSNMAGAGITSK